MNISALKEILEQSFSRYIRVLPVGFLLPYKQEIQSSLTVMVSYFHPARTLYKEKKPSCRSLNGIFALKTKKTCSSCIQKNQCTPQICLEFLYQGIPLKLLLAYTSMRKFIEFVSKHNFDSNNLVTLSVLNRGKWGEVQFTKSA